MKKRNIVILLLIFLLNCMPDTYFIGSKAEFLSMGYKESQIVKIERIEKIQSYKIYYR